MIVKEFSCVRNNAGDYEENYNFIISCVLFVCSLHVSCQSDNLSSWHFRYVIEESTKYRLLTGIFYQHLREYFIKKGRIVANDLQQKTESLQIICNANKNRCKRFATIL